MLAVIFLCVSSSFGQDSPPVLSKLEPPDAARLRDFHRLNPPQTTKGLVHPGLTMVSHQHLLFSHKAMGVLNNDQQYVAGDVVECGVWRGGSMVALVLAQIQTSPRGRELGRNFWLFDTFEGLPPPTKEDGGGVHSVWRKVHSDSPAVREEKGWATRMSGGKVKWNYGPIDVVRAALGLTGYPADQINFVRGKVEDTLADAAVLAALPEKIALLRLDTDWYKSTAAELDVLFDRLVPGGFLVVDDYCTWGGARKAVDEYFANRGGVYLEAFTRTKLDLTKSGKVCLTYRKPHPV